MGVNAMKAGDRAARVLIVDDHPAVREGLGVWIARQPDLELCGEAAEVAQALALFDEASPDVVVVDLSLKGGDGIDLIKRIRARDDHARILVWSMYPETLYAERALRAGALGYINKQEPTGRIVEAIRCVLAGKMYLSRPLSERLLRAAVGRGEGPTGAPDESLSDRELEVLRLIGRGRTTAEVADELHLSIHTIETYRRRIKAKLGLRTAAELSSAATRWVLEHG